MDRLERRGQVIALKVSGLKPVIASEVLRNRAGLVPTPISEKIPTPKQQVMDVLAESPFKHKLPEVVESDKTKKNDSELDDFIRGESYNPNKDSKLRRSSRSKDILRKRGVCKCEGEERNPNCRTRSCKNRGKKEANASGIRTQPRGSERTKSPILRR